MKISAIILTKNEEIKIEDTIKSLLFCDEIIVVDDESSDETVKKAKHAGAIVFNHAKNKEFAGQRNWAMKQAKNEWVLFIDADEDVSENMKNEIIKLLPEENVSAYKIPRRDFFWNTELKFGETRKVRTEGIIRLMRKGSGVWIGAVHETFVTAGQINKLHTYINHHSHESISSFIEDINTYSTLRAIELAQQGRKVSTFELILFPTGKFIYTYLFLGGFIDGPAGFVYSFLMSFHSFLVRAKLATKSYV